VIVLVDTKDSSEQRKTQDTISQNVSSSLFSNMAYLITRLFIPPLILHHVSLAEYGIWSYCFILLSYLGMSIFGITNVYVRYIAVYSAQGKKDEINRLLSTGVLSSSIICLIALPFFWEGLPFIFSELGISEEYYRTAFILIFSTTLIFMCDMTIGVFGYVLHSLQKIREEKIIWMVSFMIETLFIIVFLLLDFGIYSLPAAFFIRTFLSISLCAIACKRYLPELSLSIKYFDKTKLKLFYHFGGIVQLSGLLGIMNRSLEKIIAGRFINIEATALYEVGEKFPLTSLMLPSSINAVILPTVAHFHAKERKDQIAQLYLKGSRLINILTGSLMGFMAAFATPIITFWLGSNKKYEAAAQILAWFTIACQMDVLTGPASAIYRSINEPMKELIYGGFRFVAVVICVAVGFYFFGVSILVINATVVSMIVWTALFYIVFSNNYLQINQRLYFDHVLFPGLIPYLLCYALAFLTQNWFEAVTENRWKSLIYLLSLLSIYLACWMPFVYKFLCTGEERQELKRALQRSYKF
jgi:O-antigen/teichoic acid export membrane protein